MLFAIATPLTLALLPVSFWLALRKLASETLTNPAKDLGRVITDLHPYDAN